MCRCVNSFRFWDNLGYIARGATAQIGGHAFMVVRVIRSSYLHSTLHFLLLLPALLASLGELYIDQSSHIHVVPKYHRKTKNMDAMQIFLLTELLMFCSASKRHNTEDEFRVETAAGRSYSRLLLSSIDCCSCSSNLGIK
jgi:hypothetical protein